MWNEDGTGSRSGPSSFSNQRSRSRRYAVSGAEQVQPVAVEPGGHVGLQRPELLALAIVRDHRQPCLGGAKRQLFVLERDPGSEQRILELVGLLGKLRGHDPALTGLAQAVEPLALVRIGRLLGLSKRIELRAGEEIRKTCDDLRLLGGLLLPHADRPRLLGALE